MGRHAAPVDFDRPTGEDVWSPTNPVTDPLLLAAVGRRPESASRAPQTVRPVDPRSEHAAVPAVADQLRTHRPRPVAPLPIPQQRASTPRLMMPAFTDVPLGLVPRLTPSSLATAPVPVRTVTGPVTAVLPVQEGVPSSLGRRRTAALAACAVALLGAASTVATVLPASHAEAAPKGQCIDTAAQPRLLTRHHHKKRVVRAPVAPQAALSSTAIRATTDPSSSPSPSPSASASPSTAPSPSRAPSADATAPASSNDGPAPTSTSLIGGLLAGVSGALSLPVGFFTFNDFANSDVGVQLPGGLSGAGESSTVIKMNPNTSTKAGSVPTGGGTTNPLSLMKVNGGSPTLRDFTLQGTPQGHLYNGLVIRGTSDARITNVRVNAIPGNDRVNPGETFGINDFRTNGSVYSGVEVDGQGVGASALAFNSSSNPTVKDSYFHDNPYSAGLALWQTTNATITDVISKNNRTGINLERTSGTINVVRPTLLNNSSQDFYIGSDQASVKLNIVDPKFSGKVRIRIAANYWAGAEQQRRSDVHVIINGVDRTDDVVQWL